MTTTPEAKCDPAPYCSCLLCSYEGAPSFQLHGTPCCPQCRGAVQMFYPVAAPPKPADVAKVCMPTREFLRLPESAQKHIGAIEAERDALAAKVEGLAHDLAIANRRGDMYHQLAGKREAELNAERERVAATETALRRPLPLTDKEAG